MNLPDNPRIQVHRHPERGRYDRETIYAILDEGLYCHVAVIRDGTPMIIPTLHARIKDQLYFHGAVAAGLFRSLGSEQPISVSVTLLDGLVLARSAYNHSLNYRSVVIMGIPYEVTDAVEKNRILEALVEHVVPGRWEDCRQPNAKELRATRVFGVSLHEASAKIRSGPPVDDVEDMEFPVWAGVVSIHETVTSYEQDPKQAGLICQPEYLKQIEKSR